MTSSNDTSGTVARVLAMLRAIAETSGSVGVKQLADQIGLPMSTTHRLLELLGDGGFVEKEPSGHRYLLGTTFYRVASLVTSKWSLNEVIQRELNKLTGATGETSLLSIYLPAQKAMIYGAKCDSPNPMRYRIDLFEQSTLVKGSAGLAILAFLPLEAQTEIIEHERKSSSFDVAKLRRRLPEIRRTGYAHTRGEKLSDSVGVGVPLEIGPGSVVGSVALTIPEVRFKPPTMKQYVSLLQAVASKFSGRVIENSVTLRGVSA